MIKKHIPNAITCCNLLCGCIAILKAFEGDIEVACYLVGLAAIFDFFDGMAARVLNVHSPIGKDLDSLADMVSFGVVPGVIMFRILNFANHNYTLSSAPHRLHMANMHSFDSYLPYIAFMIPVFSALRLARFNNDERQIDAFIGLPTPANSIFFCSISMLIIQTFDEFEGRQKTLQDMVFYDLKYDIYLNKLGHPYFLAAVIVTFCLLMVSEIPLFSFKFKHYRWKGNVTRWCYITWCILLIAILRFDGIPLTILSYVIFSILHNFNPKVKKEYYG